MAGCNPSGRAKAGFGAACVACCGVPMLLLAGAISIGAVVTFGVTAGAVTAVFGTTWAFWRRRLPAVGVRARGVVAAAGTAVAATGLLVAGDEPVAGRSMITVGVALLTAGALLALSAAPIPADDARGPGLSRRRPQVGGLARRPPRRSSGC